MIFSLSSSLISMTSPKRSRRLPDCAETRRSKISSTRGRPCVMSPPADAAPPACLMFMVSCVPGSPMACAATVPTASPSATGFMVPKVDAIAVRADAAARLAAHRRAHIDARDAALFDMLRIVRREEVAFLVERSFHLPQRQLPSSGRSIFLARKVPMPEADSRLTTRPSFVPQSSSVTTTSCATSKRRRVR